MSRGCLLLSLVIGATAVIACSAVTDDRDPAAHDASVVDQGSEPADSDLAADDASVVDQGSEPADESGFIEASSEAVADASVEASVNVWQPLFNGVDFAGWDRYLGKPTSADIALGIDNDPRHVYSFVTIDGEPAVRISGEVWGSLISQKEFCSFHLRGQYKWGTLIWPPLNALDSGIMYMSTGPLGAVNAGGNALSDPIGSGGFMVSVEYQLTPSDAGGIYNLGPIAFQKTSGAASPALVGAWNQVDIVMEGGAVRHLLNGQEVSGGSGFRLNWPGQDAKDLSCGKLQLESEGSEIYFRRLELMVLP